MRRYVLARRPARFRAFTLIELLTVIAIIAILAALTIMASEGAMNQAARGRTRGEVQAISAALESYKADNGAYPSADTFANVAAYQTVDGTSANYQTSSQTLYQALSGQVNFATPVVGAKAYITVKASQLGNATAGNTYFQDPFGYSYGYYTGDVAVPPATQQNPPNNGTGQFDLWSTGGVLSGTLAGNAALINTWIVNWQQ